MNQFEPIRSNNYFFLKILRISLSIKGFALIYVSGSLKDEIANFLIQVTYFLTIPISQNLRKAPHMNVTHDSHFLPKNQFK